MILSENPVDYEPETILNSLGGLVYHEAATNGFLMLEEDVAEVANIYCWEGGGSALMGDMLTIVDKATLLAMKKTRKVAPYATDIYIATDEKKTDFKKYKRSINQWCSAMNTCCYRIWCNKGSLLLIYGGRIY